MKILFKLFLFELLQRNMVLPECQQEKFEVLLSLLLMDRYNKVAAAIQQRKERK